ncbi:whi5 like domain protein [Fusarium tjaetaba]|uniref:Whi5 like domain protein n=1 Tax=Fusarium tjaetaba TaxID=1567544 RepID=A0A8H5S5U4_9HYPO|nr:whi5 like domain protein [Fusarium tjaetaba]KAF5644722.1 whi5 like domain protein [Fusarium tjaetaba]
MEQSATSSSTSSPTKRRALAPLDSNALAAPKNLFKPALGHSPVKMAIEGRKRLLDIEGSAPAAKKACLGRDEDASERSASPDVSSVFDTSANDNSWATAATEHDTAAVPTTVQPTQQTATLTRQQIRQRAETLRLRLSLANYKVRTGQTTVPLSELQQRPLPRESPRVVRVQSPESTSESKPEEESETRSRRDSIDSQQTEIMEEEDEEQS